jgi:hypothetical protein
VSRTAIACALCLLIAGCAAPTASTQTTTVESDASAGPNATTESPDASKSVDGSGSANDSATNGTALEDGISVRGGSLPVEHERIFGRTTDLLGVNVSPPSVVLVKSATEIRGDTGGGESAGGQSAARSFACVMGIHGDSGEADDGEEGDEDGGNEGDEDDSGVSVAAYTPSVNSVVVNERMTAPGREAALERTMAHEFVHTVQFRQEAFGRTQRALDATRTPTRDTYLTYVSVLEGAAVYVAETYDHRYLAGDWATITDGKRYRDSPAEVKYRIARYYFGERYLRHRYDSPANVSRVYDDPPETTEQLLHNDTAASEEPRSLNLSVEPGRNRTLGRTDTNGELFTRIALGSELNASRAADAAAGWGADRLASVAGPDGTRSFVWATRWDSPAEADEFETAMVEYLDSRANPSSGSGIWRDSSGRASDEELAFRTDRTSEDTVVLFAGNESFVREANASGTSASVWVVASGDDRR